MIPAPTRIKILKGVKDKRRINFNEPQPKLEPPTCPRWLDNYAKTEWKRISPELAEIGVFTRIDRAALAGYCQAFSRWRKAETEGTEAQAINRLNQLRLLLIEFGMTPASRSRIQVLKSSQGGDPLDKILQTKREN